MVCVWWWCFKTLGIKLINVHNASDVISLDFYIYRIVSFSCVGGVSSHSSH